MKRLTCRIAFVIVTLLAAAASVALADRGAYVIRSFHTALEVERDGDVMVAERLEVDFSAPRHGIYRSIPVRYTDPRGFGYALGFRLLEVTDDEGNRQRVKQSRDGRYVNLRIGDPDREVTGSVIYIIRYRVRDALVARPEHDELYWNATGNEWQAAIEHASATVRLPEAVDDAALETAAYVGRFGSRESGALLDRPGPAEVAFASPRPLGPLEGLTVAVAWPRGLVSRPSAALRVARFLGENWVLAVPLLVLVTMLRLWWLRGRDPAGRGSVVVRYEPPEGVSPGEIGTVVDENVDKRDLTATLVDLAVRGHVRIRVDKKEGFLGLFSSESVVFERLDAGDGERLLLHEQRLLDALFAGGSEVEMDDLRAKFYRHVPEIKDALYARVVDRGYFAGKPSRVRAAWVGIGLAAGAVTFLLGWGWVMVRGGILPHALIVPIVAAVATAIACSSFAPAMPRRTRRGVELREWALGFEEFVDRVEGERLEQDRARNVFESLLPYAMALGVAAAWARRFEGVYAAGSPGWFVGHDPGAAWSTRGFERTLSHAMDRTASAMTEAPRSSGSSGSGGGGSSGGGGGGGGGGSW